MRKLAAALMLAGTLVLGGLAVTAGPAAGTVDCSDPKNFDNPNCVTVTTTTAPPTTTTTTTIPSATPTPGPNDWYTFTNPGGQTVCHQGDPSIGTSNLTFTGGPFTEKPAACGGSPTSTTTETTTTTTVVETTTTVPSTTTVVDDTTTTSTVPSTTTTSAPPVTTDTTGPSSTDAPRKDVGATQPEDPASETGKLAFTGVEDIVPIGALALGLLTGGSGLLWLGRRKNA